MYKYNKPTFSMVIIAAFLVISIITLKMTGLGPFAPRVQIEPLVINHDEDQDGILDLQDIVEGARQEVKNRTRYKSVYYAGGYPPDKEGVCTDVIWRAFKNAGYNIKEMVDQDIADNTDLYPRVLEFGGPDPNIDFRRVQNLHVFLERHAQSLTTELIPYDVENLKEWQGGDIVVFKGRINHIGIVSDKRRADGVPLIIHNSYLWAREEHFLIKNKDSIAGHYRFPIID